MRVLLDECVPRPLLRLLEGHTCQTVADRSWQGRRNSELLSLPSEAGFEAILTVDRRFMAEQQPAPPRLLIILLQVPTNRLAALQPLIPHVLRELSNPAPRVCVIDQAAPQSPH